MKKVLSIWLCITLSLWANSLVQTYRQNGLEEVEKQIEVLLQDKDYWKNFLKNKDVQKGFYEFNTPIIFVNKALKIMDLYHYKNFKQSQTSTQEVIAGKMGDKEKEGDLKTPVGVYEITKKFVPKDGFYGPVAFSLSYPNLFDRLANKNGHGIWIHGFPLNNEKRDGRTKGCIAVKNDILKKFDKDLASEKAVVIISEQGDIVVDKKEVQDLLTSLFQWKYAWKYNDLKKYLSFYGDDFKRFDGKDIKQFSDLKRRIFAKNENKIIVFKNIAISPYPDLEQKGLYIISFDEFYKTKSYTFSGKKELYVRLQNNKMQIVAEK